MKKTLFIISILFFFILVGFVDPYSRRIRPFTAVPSSCAENEVGYSMTLHKFYICTNAGYQSLDTGGATTYAPIGATYITEIADANLTNEFALASLATGILKNTTTTGIPSIAVAGTDYQVPITAGDVTTSGATSTIGLLKVTNGMLAGSIAYGKLTLTGAILNADLAGSIAYSKLILTNSIVSGDIVSLVWSKITATPTTFSGYGISDSSANLAIAISDELGSGKLIFSAGTLNITSGKTFNVSNNLTLIANDGSTLAIGGGGTLGSAAYTATSAYEVPLTFSTGLTRSTNTITVNNSQNIATLSNLTSNGFVKTSGGVGTLSIDTTTYAPLASPTFTGTVTIPTPFTIGAVSMTATGTQLNYLNAATGTTGTNTSNLVYSISPIITGNPTFGVNDWPTNTISKNNNRVIINDTVEQYLILYNSLATPAANAGADILLGSRSTAGSPSMVYARIFGYKINSTDANFLSGMAFYLLDAGGTEKNTFSLSSTGVTINGGTEIKKHLSSTATLDFGNLAAIGCENLTMTVTGAALGDTVDIGVPNASIVTNGNFFGWVSATDTVSIKFCTVVSGDPASGTFRADVWQH